MPVLFHVRSHARAVVRLRGELNRSKVDRVHRKLSRALARGPDVLEVNVSRVTFLSPECGAIFLRAASDARRSGVRLVVAGSSPRILRALRKLGLERFLDEPLPSGQ
ncbi:STAS domain-containing protein [Streptomyces sp. NPDC091416]|uniref:STAS domain-containing protein n=1 Tax=Streptomyces sp. NPDC091416 TaxID=3366003 RepID=UPI00382FA499